MSSLYSVWKNVNQIDNWTISGDSIAGIRTSFFLHDLKIQLDAGHQSFNNISTIFITHTHADHIASLPLIILENISNKVITSVYCPEESRKHLENMIDSFLACNYNNYNIPKKYYNIYGFNTNYLLELKLNNKDIVIQAFNSDHTVPTLSYGFIERKKKLKDEFIGLNSREIVQLKNDKVEITKIVHNKNIVFCGDTSINIFENNPGILEYKNIIIECTFFEESDLPLAIERKHMHWSQLKPIIESNINVNFYLIHVSAKYHDKDLIKSIIGDEISNVFFL